jgi:gliding motility-associated-like protein
VLQAIHGLRVPDASPASTTTYTVTGTSAGCSNTAVSTVTVAPSLNVTVNSPTICAGQTANLTAAGATTYVWTAGATSTGANTADATPAATTTYTVTGTTSGCTGSAISTVTVTPLPAVTVNSPTVCNGVTANLTAGGASTYAWSAGATSTGANTADAAPSTTTTYTVTGTTSGCSNTAVSTVTVNPIPNVTVNSPSICPGSTAMLTAGGATSYTWSAGATSTGANTATATPAATTTYTVTGTSLGCSNTAVSTVTVNTVLSVDAGVDDSICFGGSATLTVIPNGVGYVYTWTPAASLSNATIYNPVASPAATTTYTVNVTDANGCTGSDNVTIFADPQITLALAGLPVNCNGGSDGQTIVIPAGGSGSYTYNWLAGGCTTAACNVAAGTYTVTVTDTWGCTATGTSTVTEPTAVTATSTQVNVTCFGACNGTATATGAGGTPTASGGYNYSWNTVPVQNTQTATGLCSGTYTCTVTDANGCSTTVVVTITEPTVLAVAPIPNVTICNSGSTTLNANVTGGTGAYTYSWSPATGLSSAAVANPTASPAGTTGYTVTSTDANGCTATASVTVTVNPPLSVVTAGTASVCPGFSTPISAIAANGAGSGYTYSWSPAAGLSDPAIDMPTATPAVTTTYTVTVNDGCSPAVTATVTVTALPKPVPVITSNVTSGCAPLCVSFTDASTISSGSVAGWDWNFGDNGPDSISQNPSHCFMTAGSYTITLTDTSAAGCITTSTIPYVITVNPIPVAAASAPTSTSIFTPTVQYIDQSTISFGSIVSWDWSFGDNLSTPANDSSSLQNPSHLFSEIGSYCGDLVVTSNAGCRDTTSICIIIDPEFTFFIPNAFSPNDDGINDEFYGKGEYIKKYEMYIYDRWGNMIFAADDINKHWDGKANHGAEIAQEDVYVYVVKLTDNHDKNHKYIGTVTIVK